MELHNQPKKGANPTLWSKSSYPTIIKAQLFVAVSLATIQRYS
jgi:hypothetical protein